MSQESTGTIDTGAALNAIAETASAANAVEQAPVTEAVNEQPNDEFAAKFAALSRKEKEFKAQARAFAEQKRAWEAERSKVAEQARNGLIDPEQLKTNPFEIMKAHGITLEQLAAMAMNDGKPTPDQLVSNVESKLSKQLKELQDKLTAKEEAEAQQAQEAQLQAFKSSINEFIAADSTAYEMILAEDAQDLVFQVIETHYLETQDENGENGEIMSNKEAADAVEKFLLEKAMKLVEREKIKSKFQPPQAQKPQEVAKTVAKTLSNTSSTQVPTKTSTYLSDDASKKQAASLIRWED